MNKKTSANNGSYPMRVSEGLQVQFPQAKFVTCDTEAATQTRTGHSRNRYRQV